MGGLTRCYALGWLLMLAGAWVVWPAAAEDLVEPGLVWGDSEKGYRLALPPGFQVVPLAEAPPGIARPLPNAGSVASYGDWWLTVIEHGQPVPRHLALFRIMPDGATGEAIPLTWNGYRINAFRIHRPGKGKQERRLELLAEIPLEQQQITLHLAGPVMDLAEPHAFLQYLVNAVEGEPGWHRFWRDDWGQPMHEHPRITLALFLTLVGLSLLKIWRQAPRHQDLVPVLKYAGIGLLAALLAGLTLLWPLVFIALVLGTISFLGPGIHLWSQAAARRQVTDRDFRRRGPFT